MHNRGPSWSGQAIWAAPSGAVAALGSTRLAVLDLTEAGRQPMTTPDGRFTVVEVECLGACGFATPIMINNDFVESVTPESVSRILSELK